MNIFIVILLFLIVILEGFAGYVLGVISAKLDVIEEQMRYHAAEKQNIIEDKGERQFKALMTYNGNERREAE